MSDISKPQVPKLPEITEVPYYSVQGGGNFEDRLKAEVEAHRLRFYAWAEAVFFSPMGPMDKDTAMSMIWEHRKDIVALLENA